MPDEPLLSSRLNMLTHAQQRAYDRHGLDLTIEEINALSSLYRTDRLRVVGEAGIVDHSGGLGRTKRYHCWADDYQCYVVYDEQHRCIITFQPMDFTPQTEYAHRKQSPAVLHQRRSNLLLKNNKPIRKLAPKSAADRQAQIDESARTIPAAAMRRLRRQMGAWYKEQTALVTDQVDGEVYNHCRDLVWATFWEVPVSSLNSRTVLAPHKCGYTESLRIQRAWRKSLVDWYCTQTQCASVDTSRKFVLSDGTTISKGAFYIQRYRDIWTFLNIHCEQPNADIADQKAWRPEHFAREMCPECARKEDQ